MSMLRNHEPLEARKTRKGCDTTLQTESFSRIMRYAGVSQIDLTSITRYLHRAMDNVRPTGRRPGRIFEIQRKHQVCTDHAHYPSSHMPRIEVAQWRRLISSGHTSLCAF